MLFFYLQSTLLRTQVGEEFISKLNEYRASNNAGPVVENEFLDKAADVQATHEMNTKQCTHTGPPGNEHFKTRFQNCGYTNGTISENVAQNNAVNAEDVFQMWKKSKGHNRNMLDPDYNETGIAYKEDTDKKVYWASTFGGGGDPNAKPKDRVKRDSGSKNDNTSPETEGKTKENQNKDLKNSSDQSNKGENQPHQENSSSQERNQQESSQVPCEKSDQALQEDIALRARSRGMKRKK